MIDEAFDIMQRGGALMWVILAVSLTTMTFTGERAYVLWVRYRLNIDQFLDHLVDLLEEQKHARALEVCTAEERHPFAAVARAGLMKANGSDREIQRAMESAAILAYPSITRHTAYLGMLANVATLLGLLGTVIGLIEAFHGVTEADAAAKQEILSKGIAMAMYTTAFGLVTAIPALAAAAVLQSRERRVLVTIEAKATELLDYLTERGRAAAKRVG